ncbi:MAG: M48 family metalloprotease [Desulfobacterales bacterium]|nr:M48 family metalloprotease [Desulfobacterales bacterium]
MHRGSKTRMVAVSLIIMAVVTVVAGPSVQALTIQEEKELSKQYMQVLKRYFEFVDDPVIVDYVNAIGQRILAKMPPQPFDYQFYVIKQDVFNAFATPAGHIFVYSGLLAAMEREEQLAGLLAHEIGHVKGRHISEKIERAENLQKAAYAGMIAGLAAALAGAPEAGQAMMMGSMAGTQSVMLAYSRGDETEADQFGLNSMYRAGYDGAGMVEMFDILRSKQWFGADDIPTWVMTHPAVEERIVYVRNRVEAYNRKYGQPKAVDPMPFARMHTRLLTKYSDPAVVMNRYRKAYEADPEDPIRNFQYGLILARTDQRDQAVIHLRRALDVHPLDPFILGSLGRVYFQDGQYEKAEPMLKGAVGAAPRDAEYRFYLGRLQQEMGQYQEAVTTYRAILVYHPRHLPTHYFLGKAYSQIGQRGEAYFHLGLYYYGKGQHKKAKFQLEKALTMTTDANRREEIDKLLANLEPKKKKNAERSNRRKR